MTDDPTPILCATTLTKVYAEASGTPPALDGVTLSVGKGEFVALCGASGSGKSTFLNIAGLVEEPTSGTVEIGEEKVEFENERQMVRLRRNAIGYVFQRFNLLPTFTLIENVAFPLILKGQSTSDALKRASEVLGTLGLESKAAAMPAQLSGGEMQRAAVMRAAIHRPALILADEPTGSLDSKNGTAVLELLRQLTASGSSVLMATHSMAATAYADRLVWITDGRLGEMKGSTW